MIRGAFGTVEVGDVEGEDLAGAGSALIEQPPQGLLAQADVQAPQGGDLVWGQCAAVVAGDLGSGPAGGGVGEQPTPGPPPPQGRAQRGEVPGAGGRGQRREGGGERHLQGRRPGGGVQRRDRGAGRTVG